VGARTRVLPVRDPPNALDDQCRSHHRTVVFPLHSISNACRAAGSVMSSPTRTTTGRAVAYARDLLTGNWQIVRYPDVTVLVTPIAST
jgi:hypothetical protein